MSGRPIYENATTLKAERVLIERCLTLSRIREPHTEFLKLPIRYQVEGVFAVRNTISLIAEFKCRNHLPETYPTLILSLLKVDMGMRLADTIGKPFKFVVEFSDRRIGVWTYQPWKPVTLDVRPGGRQDRGDAQDMELVVHFPIKDLRWVKTTK